MHVANFNHDCPGCVGTRLCIVRCQAVEMLSTTSITKPSNTSLHVPPLLNVAVGATADLWFAPRAADDPVRFPAAFELVIAVPSEHQRPYTTHM